MKPTSAFAHAVGLTLLITAVAVAVRWWLDPQLGDELALVTLYGAIMFSVWMSGVVPALVVATAGYIACNYLFIPPRGEFSIQATAASVGLLAYVVSVAILIGFGLSLRIARQDARARADTLRTTLNSIGDAVITADIGGNVTSMNLAAVALTGWSSADARGKPLGDVFRVVDGTTRTPMINPVGAVLQSDDVVVLDRRAQLTSLDGEQRPIELNAAPVRDESGKTFGAVLVFRDITDRKAAEAALQRSEHELNDFFENASVGLHWVGPDGTILRANQAELKLLGYREDEFVGHHVAEFHADQDVIESILESLKRDETIRSHPARMHAKDGSIRTVLIDSNSLFENGEFIHSRCFTRDISDRVQAQRLQALLAGIVESSSDAIVSKSLDGIVTSWNAGATRIFEYEPDEIVGRPINLIIPPDRQDEEVSILRRLREGEHIEPFETVRLAKSGRRVNISVTISPLRDEYGQIFGASKVARDITERKNAELALQASEQQVRTTSKELVESEERFRMLADNISQFAWIADAEGWIYWYNQRWYDYTGTTLEEMQGWGWRKVHHPDYVDAVVERVQHSWDTGEVWEDTFPLRSKHGNYRWFLSRALPIRDDSGKILRWFGTNTDITEQRAAEEALRDADHRKNEFLATLSHELRNPLAPISNMVEILQRRGQNRRDRTIATDTIARQLDYLVRLVDDLLDIDRITRGKITLRREQVDLGTVIHQAYEGCASLFEASHQTANLDLPEAAVNLNADPVRLTQVFGNLLRNASKYTPHGGEISLAVRAEGGWVSVSVKDNGIGIAPEKLTEVFELFAQVDESPDRAHSGIGIGLTLARRFVELHGGTIEAFSDGLGKGSEFVTRLPILAQESPQLPAEKVSDEAGIHSHRILVVDDNEDSATSLATLLEITGHETHTAHDGVAALAVAARIRPNVILLDIGLPHKNGYEVCREIRREPWGKGVLMIAITGWGQEEDRIESTNAGFDQHLTKPIDFGTLNQLLVAPID